MRRGEFDCGQAYVHYGVQCPNRNAVNVPNISYVRVLEGDQIPETAQVGARFLFQVFAKIQRESAITFLFTKDHNIVIAQKAEAFSLTLYSCSSAIHLIDLMAIGGVSIYYAKISCFDELSAVIKNYNNGIGVIKGRNMLITGDGCVSLSLNLTGVGFNNRSAWAMLCTYGGNLYKSLSDFRFQRIVKPEIHNELRADALANLYEDYDGAQK